MAAMRLIQQMRAYPQRHGGTAWNSDVKIT